MNKPTLDNCDNEPIHIPGAIQNHGFHIATDKNQVICYCSANIEHFIAIPANDLLGCGLADNKLGKQTGQQLQAIVTMATQDDTAQNCFKINIGDRQYNVIINLYKDYHTLDFEPVGGDVVPDIESLIGKSLSEILSEADLPRLLDNAALQIRRIIGYDRVMVYKFHDDGHGEVVAEAKTDELESWMGLHYPASDIPKQARELYKINQVRLIADVHSTPAALLTNNIDSEGKVVPLDLTHSTLRAVSPIHIQYLKNMGVASSFSVSVMEHDKLWGLIACHNYSPRFINYRDRESAKLVGKVLSSAVSFREQAEDRLHAAEHRQAVDTITRYLLRNIAVEDALINQECTLKDVLDSDGAALFYENKLHTTGNVPDDKFINELISWLGEKTLEHGYFYTDKLCAELPSAHQHKLTASGILACKMGKSLNEYMIWFRPEVISTVKWAGNPDKTVQPDANGMMHISPRHSFEEWSQQVEFTSVAWKKHELDAALSLRDEVNYAISRKATELRVINEKLRAAYAELDAFSYTISHDLKNPLASIRSYAQLIKRGLSDPTRNISMAERIEKGTEKMQLMIDEVLAYSKAGQERLEIKAIDMQKMLEELRHELLVASDNPNLEITINETPEIYGDELMVMQVFSNLIGNAVKYSRKSIPSVVDVSGTKNDDQIIYAIADNGIGIPHSDHGKIFDLFSRASETGGIEGTGVGLAIVKRILEKHQGRIWLDSQPGKGSVFFVSFKHFGAIHHLN